jgi:hypothetical protein
LSGKQRRSEPVLKKSGGGTKRPAGNGRKSSDVLTNKNGSGMKSNGDGKWKKKPGSEPRGMLKKRWKKRLDASAPRVMQN